MITALPHSSMLRRHALLMLLVFAAGVAAAAQPKLEITTDRPDAIYQSGQTATFTITPHNLEEVDSPIQYSILRDGIHIIDEGSLALESSPISVSASLAEPGNLILNASIDGPTGQVKAAMGVMFDPYEIKPGIVEEPEGYEAFWQAQRELLRRDPAEPILTPVDSGREGITMLDVTIPMPEGRPVRGYFALPADAAPGAHPAMLYVHGAGVRGAGKSDTVRSAAEGMIALEINAHGIDNAMPAQFYTDFHANELGGVYYPHIGRESRETWYMLNMYRRVMRALDFLAERPEWDGRILVTSGSSQGGAQSIAAAGLDPRVTAFVAYVPGMVDLAGCVAGRIGGWPRPVPVNREDGRCTDTAILEEVRFFDGVHFTRRTKAEGFFTVGLIDMTCPPTSIFAAFNQMPPERRKILIFPAMGHSTPAKLRDQGFQFVLDHIQRMRQQNL